MFKKPDEKREDRSRRYVRKNYTYHKDIGHNTVKCNDLMNEMERLIRTRHFNEFMENEPQVAVINERLRQRSLERIRKVLKIFRGLHVARESRNACDRYAKEERNAPLTHVHRIDERLVKSVC